MKLYMFRTAPLSIIRSLFTVHSAMVYAIPLLSVQWINSWWWTEELSKTCRVSCQNKLLKLVHLVGFIMKKRKQSLLLILSMQFFSHQPAYSLLLLLLCIACCIYSEIRCRTFTFLLFLSSVYFQVQTRSAGPVESVVYVNEVVRLLLPGERYWH